MQLPEALIKSLEGLEGFNRPAFENIHMSGQQITSIRINPLKNFSHQFLNVAYTEVPWTQYGYYLKERPSFTFDPLFHAGCYYVQEASSMFLEQALKQTLDLAKPLKILDLSAAPGGKSTHIQSLISKESLLISNEVIRTRAGVLKDNIIKWGCKNVMITNNDPRDFAKLESYFDVIIVDAPCSGSGLFRRDPAAIGEWSENNVQLCCQRQQRIIADAWPALKNEGILIYSTCSYSRTEDEDIIDWMVKGLECQSLQLDIDRDWGITEVISGNCAWGYRFWPYHVKGEGLFMACLQKKEGPEPAVPRIRKHPVALSKNERVIVDKWVDAVKLSFIKNENTVYAWPEHFMFDFTLLLNLLHVVYSGTIIGEIVRDKLIPHHALAMSTLANKTTPSVELDYKQAIEYLQRKDLRIKIEQAGWQLVKYEGNSLGWINVLPNRINNYYPKELRILKDI